MKESNEIVSAPKTVYKFKPALHWNYITKEQYDVLWRLYSNEMLKIEEEE